MHPTFADRITSGCCRLQMPEFAIAQLVGKLGLQHRIRTGRAAAHVAFGERRDLGAKRR